MRIRALQTRADRLAQLVAFLNRRHVLVHRLLPGQVMLEALGLPLPNGHRGIRWDAWRAPHPLPLPALRAPLPAWPGGLWGAESPPAEAPARSEEHTSELQS